MSELDDLLKKTGLRSADDSASTIFSQIVNLFRRITSPKSAELAASITADGLPIIAPASSLGTLRRRKGWCGTMKPSVC